jgi:hypothetical protein
MTEINCCPCYYIPSTSTTLEDVGLDVRVEVVNVIDATIMEE